MGVHEITSIDSKNNLVERFGKPTTSVYYDFMTMKFHGIWFKRSRCARG